MKGGGGGWGGETEVEGAREERARPGEREETQVGVVEAGGDIGVGGG